MSDSFGLGFPGQGMSEDQGAQNETCAKRSAKSEHDAALEAAHDLGCKLVFGHWIAPGFFPSATDAALTTVRTRRFE
jgi:hypothetical protein